MDETVKRHIVWLQLIITCICVCVCAHARVCMHTWGVGSIKNATYARQWWPESKDFCHLSVNHIRNIKQYRGKLASYYKLCIANQMAYSEPEWNKDCNIFKSDILLWSRYIEVRMVALKHNNSLHVVKLYCQMFWIMYKEPRYQRKETFLCTILWLFYIDHVSQPYAKTIWNIQPFLMSLSAWWWLFIHEPYNVAVKLSYICIQLQKVMVVI